MEPIVCGNQRCLNPPRQMWPDFQFKYHGHPAFKMRCQNCKLTADVVQLPDGSIKQIQVNNARDFRPESQNSGRPLEIEVAYTLEGGGGFAPRQLPGTFGAPPGLPMGQRALHPAEIKRRMQAMPARRLK